MLNEPQQTKSPELTPEQLLTMLDLQIAAKKARKRGSSRSRGVLLALGLLLIIAGCLGALLILRQSVGDLSDKPRSSPVAAPISQPR
jgi:hypothetical protein